MKYALRLTSLQAEGKAKAKETKTYAKDACEAGEAGKTGEAGKAGQIVGEGCSSPDAYLQRCPVVIGFRRDPA